MSRSHRKHPIHKYHFKGGKRRAARAFRRFNGDIPIRSRQFYRRVYNSWNVWDNWYQVSDFKQRQQRIQDMMNELVQNFEDKHLTYHEATDMTYDIRWLYGSLQLLRK